MHPFPVLVTTAAMLVATAIGTSATAESTQQQPASVQLVRGGGGGSGGGGGGYYRWSENGNHAYPSPYGFVCPPPYDICHPVLRGTPPRTPAAS